MKELFDKVVPYDMIKTGDGDIYAYFSIDDIQYTFSASKYSNIWEISFDAVLPTGVLSMGKTDTGNQFTVFATIGDILITFIKQYKPNQFSFTASKADGRSRERLYLTFAKEITKRIPYSFETQDEYGEVIYLFQRI